MTGEILTRERLARLVRGGPPPLLYVALLAVLAVQPFLSASFPASADGKLHLYRLIEFDHALRHGVLWQRWSPDLVYGYGFPLFNYYAPLPYYLGAAFHLFGFSYQGATQAAFAALIVLAGWACYRWAADLFGPAAGVVAAAAYLYAPYVGHAAVHRGALGELAGLALMPLILWSFSRLALAVNPSRGQFAAASVSLGALLLAHNLTALLFAPILLAASVILWLAGGRQPRAALAMLGALVTGVLLGAIFWLPAFAERDLVQIDRLFGPAAFDFRLHFLTLKGLLTPPPPIDPRQLRSTLLPALGLPQVALALLALWRVVRGQLARSERIMVGTALAGAALLTSLTLPVSLPLWESVGLLRFVQFPWRLLGPASLLVAFLAGAALAPSLSLTSRIGACGGNGKNVRNPNLTFAVLAIATYSLWWLFGEYEPPLAASRVQDIHAFEVAFDAAGTTSFVDYLPVTVAELPPQDGLSDRYARSDVISRLSAQGLPQGGRILSQSAGLNWARASVDSPTRFTATWDWFAFPGWQASLDGAPVAITPGDPYGLMQIQVPAGQHDLSLRFGLTPIRLGAQLASLAGLLALALGVWRLPAEATQGRPHPALAWRHLWPLVGIVLLLLVKLAYLDHADSFFRRSRFDGQGVRGLDGQARVLLEDQMVYLGYERSAETVAAGQALGVTLYWAPQRPLDVDYSTSAVLRDEAGSIIAQADNQHPADWPTSRWGSDQYAADLHPLLIPPDTPPGSYQLETAVYSSTRTLAALDEAGNPAGTSIPVMLVEVTRPATPPDPARIEVQYRVDALLAPSLELVGYDLSSRDLAAGQTLALELVWHARQRPIADLSATITLRDGEGRPIVTESLPPVSESYPTSAWPPGEVVRGRQHLTLPADLAGGEYSLELTLEGGQTLSLGQLRVSEPTPPIYEMPDLQHPIGQGWRGGISLLGYDLSREDLAPGASLDLTLYWRAARTPPASYKAFVHLVDASGQVRAQRDQIPANWTRPTTSWRPREIIADPYSLPLPADLPPGTYTLRVGLYEESSLQSLLLSPGEADSFEFTTLSIGPSE